MSSDIESLLSSDSESLSSSDVSYDMSSEPLMLGVLIVPRNSSSSSNISESSLGTAILSSTTPSAISQRGADKQLLFLAILLATSVDASTGAVFQLS